MEGEFMKNIELLFPRERKRRIFRGGGSPVATFCLYLILCTSASFAAEHSSGHADLFMSEFRNAQLSKEWIEENLESLTPELIAEIELVASHAAQTGEFEYAWLAYVLNAMVHTRIGARYKGLDSWLSGIDMRFQLADTIEAYRAVRDSARDTANKALSIGAEALRFRAHVIAADAAYFASKHQSLDSSDRGTWRIELLEDVMRASMLARGDSGGVVLERFASLIMPVLDGALNEPVYTLDSEVDKTLLSSLAEPLERAIPVGFEFQRLPGSDRYKTALLSIQLAELSYLYGNHSNASKRLVIEERNANQVGDRELWLDIVFQRYLGERDRDNADEQVTQLRTTLRSGLREYRSEFVSRAGRLWAANRADRILGEMLRHQLDEQSVDLATAFGEVEALKARMLLDHLGVAFSPPADGPNTNSTVDLETDLLGFPECQRNTKDPFLRELYLISRVPVGGLFPEDDYFMRLAELEKRYGLGYGGFDGVAYPRTLSEIQRMLAPDELLVEYFVPFHGSHPAREIWIIAADKTQGHILKVPLKGLMDAHTGFVGRVSIDGCPPIDASPLGDGIALLRRTIQNSDEKSSQRMLHGFYQLLVEPLVEKGLFPEKYSRWIVVPHGPLHYLPFGALVDSNNQFLIERVALALNPSASVWYHTARKDATVPETVLGLFAPSLGESSELSLPDPRREIRTISRHFELTGQRLYSGAAATEERFLEDSGDADVLHFSTHGEFPEKDALDFHRILLSKTDYTDGRLYAHEIRTMQLSCRPLVVLAICNGGVYNIGPADEPYGLFPAFVQAGASSIVTTLWSLEDRFGREFISRFYTHLMERGPADALRQAAIEYIREEELIRRWAAIAMFGSGRPFK